MCSSTQACTFRLMQISLFKARSDMAESDLVGVFFL